MCSPNKKKSLTSEDNYGDSWGYINKTGEMVIPSIYISAGTFYNEHANVRSHLSRSDYTIIDKQGNLVGLYKWYLNKKYFLNKVIIKNKFGFANELNEIVVPAIYDEVKDFSEGLAAVAIWNNPDSISEQALSEKWRWHSNYDGKKWGFVETQGNVVVPVKYDIVECFNEGLAVVGYINFKSGSPYNTSSRRYGYVDKYGNEIINCKYESASEFIDGIARVNNHCFINVKEEIIINSKFNVSLFENGLAEVVESDYDNFLGYINKKGVEYWEDEDEDWAYLNHSNLV